MRITEKLHHREPYLLLQEIQFHDSSALAAVTRFHGEEFFLRGHFPGTPVVPGAIMQEMTTQAAGLLITLHHSPVPDYHSDKTKGWALGVLHAIHGARYKSFARPGELLGISVKLTDVLETAFRFRGKIETGDRLIMTNEFTLVNISEDQLRGHH